MNALLTEKLAKLPEQPGCYLMKDSNGAIIYVGKAVNLKNRVRSYFHSPASHNGKTNLLVEHIADFDTVVVNTEADALILEANLIKEHSPYYNILMRDDKYYPYLCLTMTEQFPRLTVARRAKNDGNLYFGPYPDVGGMRRVMQLLEELFPLRSCGSRPWPAGHRACLNAHIGRCLAPCEGRISREAYLAMVTEVELFLRGKAKGLLNKMETQMRQASEELRFEDAARFRDAAAMIRQVQTRQQLDMSANGGNYDMAAIATGGGQAVVQLFFTRGGKVVNREHFFLTNGEDAAGELLMHRFLQEYYGGGQMVPSAIYVDTLPEAQQFLAEQFSRDAGHKVEILLPQRGDKRRLLNLVRQNAELILTNTLNSREKQQEQNAAALEELRLLLHLEHAPARIECYDISHIQGSNMVGSMVVFLNGAASPKHYRRFKIKTLEGSNDFAALQEVLERRWRRGWDEKAAGKQPLDFGDFPDLLVIDGGKGQLSAVCERLAAIGAEPAAIISLAKKQEEIFVPGQSDSLQLPESDEARKLLQRLRDEAHRFAITYHRQLRKKSQVRSKLDDAPQIGEKRRRSLLKAFGSLKHIEAASVEELTATPGMTAQAAAALFQYLHSQQENEATETKWKPDGQVEAQTENNE